MQARSIVPYPVFTSEDGSVDSGSAVTNAMEQLTTDSRDKMEVVEDSSGSGTTSKTGSSSQLQQQIKQIKPLLSGSSRLGRALAELFGLLVKVCVGSPLRQRRGQQIPPTPAMPAPPARSVDAAGENGEPENCDGVASRAPKQFAHLNMLHPRT